MQAIFEKVRPSDQASFRCFERVGTGFPFRWHYHPECELALVEHSRGRRFVGDHIADYRDGDLVLLGPNVPHTWASDPAFSKREIQRAVVIQFDPGFLGQGWTGVPELRGVAGLLERAGRGLFFTGRVRREVTPMLKAMPGMEVEERLPALISVLQRLARAATARPLASAAFKPSLRRETHRRIDAACQYLNEHFAGPVGQADVAGLLRMNTSAFSRFFRKATGRTMTRYVIELRVGMACRLLLETELSVSEICYRVGFNNLSNFNHQFRTLKKLSPGKFRVRYGQPQTADE